MIVDSVCRIRSLGLGPYQATSLRAGARLDVLALGEALPQVAEEVRLLLDVAFTKQRSNGPGSLLSMIEGNAPILCQQSTEWRIQETYGNMW